MNNIRHIVAIMLICSLVLSVRSLKFDLRNIIIIWSISIILTIWLCRFYRKAMINDQQNRRGDAKAMVEITLVVAPSITVFFIFFLLFPLVNFQIVASAFIAAILLAGVAFWIFLIKIDDIGEEERVKKSVR